MKGIRSLLRLWPYLKPHLFSLIMASVLAIPLIAVNVGPAPAINYLQENVLKARDPVALRNLVQLMILGVLVNFIFRFSSVYMARAASMRIIQKLRNDLYQKLLSLSMGYFNEAQGGVLLSRLVNDVQVIVRSLSTVTDLFKEPITLLALLSYAFYLNPRLTLLTLLIIPLCALLLGNSGKHSKRYSHRILEKLGEMSSLIGQSISGMRVIQAFHLEGFLRGQFMKLNRDFTRTSLKAIRMEELARSAVESVFVSTLALLIYLAGREALKGYMSSGDMLAFFACFGMMLNPLRKINELNLSLGQAVGAVNGVFAILHATPEIEDSPGARAMQPFTSRIAFKSVAFQYAGQTSPILKDFGLEVKKGEIVALVGASGAGKSTVLSLIMRFSDPTAGAILVDDVNLRDSTLESLRSQVALVTQEVFLFHDTVRANIKAGRHSVSDAQIRAAAEAAQAWSFIEKLPQGLDTVIGDRGQKLSGGERQRLSIARAILKDAPILLLDEATSALDTENERLVQAALDRLLVGRTAIVVAHRLSTIRKANRILVMERGRVLEEGSHEVLLAHGGAYAKALALQEGFQG